MPITKQQASQHFKPARQQAVYCLIIAILVALYWCRGHLIYLLVSSTGTSTGDLHAGFTQALGQVTNNKVVSYLSLAVFWGLVGLVVAATLYESANVLVAARNDYVISTSYTNARDYQRNVVRTVLARLLLAIGFLAFALISWTILFHAWHGLIVQPVHIFFNAASIVKELVGLVGLTVNIYLGWMWMLFLVPQLLSGLA